MLNLISRDSDGIMEFPWLIVTPEDSDGIEGEFPWLIMSLDSDEITGEFPWLVVTFQDSDWIRGSFPDFS